MTSGAVRSCSYIQTFDHAGLLTHLDEIEQWARTVSRDGAKESFGVVVTDEQDD